MDAPGFQMDNIEGASFRQVRHIAGSSQVIVSENHFRGCQETHFFYLIFSNS